MCGWSASFPPHNWLIWLTDCEQLFQVNWKAVVKKDHDGNGMIECEINLGPYESLDVPEQFMVVRT